MNEAVSKCLTTSVDGMDPVDEMDWMDEFWLGLRPPRGQEFQKGQLGEQVLSRRE